MLKATVCDGLSLDALTLCANRLSPSELDLGRRGVLDAVMIADML
jgi:hypothetical protein